MKTTTKENTPGPNFSRPLTIRLKKDIQSIQDSANNANSTNAIEDFFARPLAIRLKKDIQTLRTRQTIPIRQTLLSTSSIALLRSDSRRTSQRQAGKPPRSPLPQPVPKTPTHSRQFQMSLHHSASHQQASAPKPVTPGSPTHFSPSTKTSRTASTTASRNFWKATRMPQPRLLLMSITSGISNKWSPNALLMRSFYDPRDLVVCRLPLLRQKYHCFLSSNKTTKFWSRTTRTVGLISPPL